MAIKELMEMGWGEHLACSWVFLNILGACGEYSRYSPKHPGCLWGVQLKYFSTSWVLVVSRVDILLNILGTCGE